MAAGGITSCCCVSMLCSIVDGLSDLSGDTEKGGSSWAEEKRKWAESRILTHRRSAAAPSR